MIEAITALGAASLWLFGVWCGEEWARSKARRHFLCPTCLGATDSDGVRDRSPYSEE